MNWCLGTVVLGKTPENHLDCKEIKWAHLKGNQPWILLGRTDAEALILRPPDGKNPLIGKGADAGKDWRQEEKEDRMRRLDSITESMDMSLSNSRRQWRTGKSGLLRSTGLQSQVGLSNWTTPHRLCQDILVNGFLEQGVGIEPCSIHSTHWPGIVVASGIVHPSQGKEKVSTAGLLQFSVSSSFCFWVLVLCEGFCFVLPMCDFLFPCWGGLLMSTISLEGHIIALILW